MAIRMRGRSGERGLCQANAAARVLGGGAMTCHAFIHQVMGEKVTRSRTKKQESAEKEAGNLLSLTLDEFSMIAMELLDAVEEWCALGAADPGETSRDRRHTVRRLFGGIAAVVLLGDFYQLPPVLAQGAAQMHSQEANKFETAQAWEKYKQIENAIVLRETNRFESEVLERVTNDWRNGRRSEEATWNEFAEVFEGADEHMAPDGTDARFADEGFLDAAFISDPWQAPPLKKPMLSFRVFV